MAKIINRVKKSSGKDFLTSIPLTGGSGSRKFRRIIIFSLLLFILAFFLYRGKNLFVVAVVNGKPITRWELNDDLTKRYGDRTLETMISERLVTDEIKKQNVTVSDEELKTKLTELTASLPKGVSLDEALKAQGISQDQFNSQLKLQIAVDKLLGQDVSVSAKEVDDYIKENKQLQAGTDPAKFTQQVETILRKQKIEELFQGWFASLKEKASIHRFL